MTIDLLEDLTRLEIESIEFEDLKHMEYSSGYDFSIIKLKAILSDMYSESKISSTTNEKDLYIKIIKKDRIKESIFCYWSLLYDENFKNYEESEFTSIIGNVRITETENLDYKHSVLLQIKENKWGILNCGSTIHLVKLNKFLNSNISKKSKLTSEWKKYLEEDNQDVLFIGVIN